VKNDRNKQLALTLSACDCCTVFLSHILHDLIVDIIVIWVALLLCVQKGYISNICPRTDYPSFGGVLESFSAYFSIVSCIRP